MKQEQLRTFKVVLTKKVVYVDVMYICKAVEKLSIEGDKKIQFDIMIKMPFGVIYTCYF